MYPAPPVINTWRSLMIFLHPQNYFESFYLQYRCIFVSHHIHAMFQTSQPANIGNIAFSDDAHPVVAGAFYLS